MFAYRGGLFTAKFAKKSQIGIFLLDYILRFLEIFFKIQILVPIEEDPFQSPAQLADGRSMMKSSKLSNMPVLTNHPQFNYLKWLVMYREYGWLS